MFKKILSFFQSKEQRVCEILKENNVPKELVDIIYSYTTELEKINKIIKYANKHDIGKTINFTYQLTRNGRSREINYHIHKIIQEYDLGFTEDEIFEIIVENVDLYQGDQFIGIGMYMYAKIEDLPRDFVRRWKDRINWDYVGSGINYCRRYTKIEDLPRDFVEEFKDYIDWNYVGSGITDKYNYTKIEDLPLDFVEQFSEYIKK